MVVIGIRFVGWGGLSEGCETVNDMRKGIENGLESWENS